MAKSLESPAWNVTRTCLGKTFASGATFHAAVVDNTGSNAVPFVDALHREWKSELDADKHVLVAVGVKSHAVAVHVGNRWSELGLRSIALRALIDGSYEKNEDRPQAVCALADAIVEHLREEYPRELAAAQDGP